MLSLLSSVDGWKTRIKISVLMITKNTEKTIEKSLESVCDWVDEIIIIDDYSTDKTIEKIKKFKRVKVFQNHEENLAKQRAFGLGKCRNDWVLVLDADEIISDGLKKEIVSIFKSSKFSNDGYLIPFQNHYLGRQLRYGGENYKKMILFKKDKVKIDPRPVGEKFEFIDGKPGRLKNKIYHYSYRSIGQIYKKFTHYALLEAKYRISQGEKVNLKKIFLYPLHMFWARFIKDKGYKDGLFRLPLDLGFAYMEFLMYLRMMFIKKV